MALEPITKDAAECRYGNTLLNSGTQNDNNKVPLKT